MAGIVHLKVQAARRRKSRCQSSYNKLCLIFLNRIAIARNRLPVAMRGQRPKCKFRGHFLFCSVRPVLFAVSWMRT